MNKDEFVPARRKLGRTQKQLAELLGVSIKTIHSYEQGRRAIPSHIERQIFFLLSNQRSRKQNLIPCWEKKQCGYKESCPAWEFQSGHLCWFLCGTKCECTVDTKRHDKLQSCRNCKIFTSLLE
jgi:hypothetical protein